MKTLRSISLLSAVALLATATSARAQENPFKFEFHGFVTGSVYYQDQVFALQQGQGLLLAAPSNATRTGGTSAGELAAPPKSGELYGGDVRQSRFSFGVTAPAVKGMVPRAYLEFDLLGNFTGSAFGPQQSMPRIRIAIAELKLGNTLIQAGQQNQLIIPQIPATIAHIANPVTYAAGSIGWRTPGLRVTHSLPAGPAKIEVAVEVVQNNWNDTVQALGPALTTTGSAPFPDPAVETQNNQGFAQFQSLGQSGPPMVQGRVKADGKAGALAYSAYVVGEWHQLRLKGFGDVCTVPPAGASTCQAIPAGFSSRTIDGYAAEVGGKVTFAPVTLAVNAYTGNATGAMLGSIVQFGDIEDMGAWANLGLNVTKELSIWGLYGTNRPSKKDVRRWAGNSARLSQDLYGGMIQYAMGAYRFGVEGYMYETKYGNGTATGTKTNDGLQVIGSAGVFF